MAPARPELPELLVADQAGLRAWLKDNHVSSDGVRLVLARKGGAETTLTWAQAVEELLCYGWIDGQGGKRDDTTYTIRITPRRARSMWSQRNVALVEQLEKQRRMRAAGRAQVEAAKADGRWAAAYSASSVAEVPADLLEAVAAEPEAQRMFDVLTKTNRFALYHRLNAVKRAETRERKIREFVAMLARHEAPYPQKARPE
jgi:uncharacterized protein YdeI (YjbR/CyaY-like superfamily)